MRLSGALSAVALLAGCTNVYQELLTPRTTPGGIVRVQLAGSDTMRAATAMGETHKERFEVSGFSPDLTFGLVAGEDRQGRAAKLVLVEPGSAIDLGITALSSTRLQVHLEGGGCVAEDGEISLRIDADRHLEGEFSAIGTISGGTAACAFSGELVRIPIERL